jgi:hypothetical protein
VSALRRASPEQFARVGNGTLPLTLLMKPQPPSDESVRRYVSRIGANRVLAALDALTAPVAAE